LQITHSGGENHTSLKLHGLFHAFMSDKAEYDKAGIAVVGGWFYVSSPTNKNPKYSLFSRNQCISDSCLQPPSFFSLLLFS